MPTQATPDYSIVKEAPGQYAVVDWNRGGATASINTVMLFRTERDAQAFAKAAARAKAVS